MCKHRNSYLSTVLQPLRERFARIVDEFGDQVTADLAVLIVIVRCALLEGWNCFNYTTQLSSLPSSIGGNSEVTSIKLELKLVYKHNKHDVYLFHGKYSFVGCCLV